jgi:hypothetical protein
VRGVILAGGSDSETELHDVSKLGLDKASITSSPVVNVCSPKMHDVFQPPPPLPLKEPAFSHPLVGMIYPQVYQGNTNGWWTEEIQIEKGFLTAFDFDERPTSSQLEIVDEIIKTWPKLKPKLAAAILNAYRSEIRPEYAHQLNHSGYSPVLTLLDLPELSPEDDVWGIIILPGSFSIWKSGGWDVAFATTFDSDHLLRVANNKGELSAWME